MTTKQLIAIITALEDSSRIIAKSECISESMKAKAKGEASAYATVLAMLRNPEYASEVAEIYGVEI